MPRTCLDSAGAIEGGVVGVAAGKRPTVTNPQRVASKVIPRRLDYTIWAATTPRLAVVPAVMPHHAAMMAPTPGKTVGVITAAATART